LLAGLLLSGFVVGDVEAALVQWWTFDDGSGTTATNQVGGGNTGTLKPTGSEPLWITTGLAPELTGRASVPSTAALEFSPVDPQDYVDGGILGLASTGSSGEATVSLWVKPDPLAADLRLFGQLTGPTTNGGAVRTTALGGLEVWTGAVWLAVAPASTLANGQWAHVALAWSLGTVNVYVDGAFTGSAASDFDFTTDGFGIGARFVLTHGKSFDGAIDDVAVWDTRLPAGAITALASGATPLEASVPEPATASLVAVGLLIVGWLGSFRERTRPRMRSEVASARR
jgi:hypothetical protein